MWPQSSSNLTTRTEAILITRVANVRTAFTRRRKITCFSSATTRQRNKTALQWHWYEKQKKKLSCILFFICSFISAKVLCDGCDSCTTRELCQKKQRSKKFAPVPPSRRQFHNCAVGHKKRKEVTIFFFTYVTSDCSILRTQIPSCMNISFFLNVTLLFVNILLFLFEIDQKTYQTGCCRVIADLLSEPMAI